VSALRHGPSGACLGIGVVFGVLGCGGDGWSAGKATADPLVGTVVQAEAAADPPPCPPGRRDYGDGACRLAHPCLDDDPCGPTRTCWNDGRGRATCGACRDGFIPDPTATDPDPDPDPDPGAGGSADGDAACVPDPGPHDHVGPARAGRESLMLWDGTMYRPRFLRGIDLGVGVPGHRPADLAISRDQYRRWIAQMGEAGFDTVRVLTLHPPRFYEELRRYNAAHPDAPLFLVQGVWLGESETGPDGDLHAATDAFDAEIERVVDAIHGDAEIPERAARGWGRFSADVTDWTIAILIGREVFAHEVLATDRSHPDDRRFEGQAFTLTDGNPASVWVAARLDHVVAYERARFGTERPVGFSNWLELDPLDHPTEPDSSRKDVAAIDLAALEATDAPAGHFVSFHAYPHYPHFVNDDPGYRTYADALGPNSYLGLLDDLRRHYRGKPVIIAEYGIPSSWGLTKRAHSGMHHGGHTETAQGVLAARMLRNIFATGLAGAFYFHWMDGWFKRIWMLEERTFPASRLALWPDLTNPQQCYGLVAFEPPGPDWGAAGTTNSRVDGRVTVVQGAATADAFHVEVTVDPPLADGERVTVAFDTHGDDLGALVLPGGEESGGRRVELALSYVANEDTARLEVIGPYDLQGIPAGTLPEGSLGRSVPMIGGDWRVLRWTTSVERCTADGADCFPGHAEPVGRLRARRAGVHPPSSQDAVIVDGGTVRVRVPWTFLQLTDPSRRMVFADDPTTPGWDAVETPGIAVVVTVADRAGRNAPVVGRGETDRIGWATWDVPPPTTERFKAGAETFFEAVRALPPVR